VNEINNSKPSRRLFITDVHARGNPTSVAASELLKLYGSGHFEHAGTIEEADVVLYLENGYVGLADLPRLLRRLRAAPSAMHFLFSESDWPFPVLPGAYPSLSKPCPWGTSWSFLPSLRLSKGEASGSTIAEPEFLFSFLGRVATHPVRKMVSLLDSPSTPCLDLADASDRFPCFDYTKTYAQLLERSRFILCPRGFGASSIRIFEAMSFGRVPVIISDAWQPSSGVPWGEFSVRIPERDVCSIPTILERLESKAQSMGELARHLFDTHFAPAIFLDQLVNTLISNYANLSFTAKATYWRAWRATGWPEIRSLCHQARSWALNRLAASR
jgi:hypothetical protein